MSKAPSALTGAIAWSVAICSISSGSMGASPTRLPVTSIARISNDPASTPRWTFRHWRPFGRTMLAFAPFPVTQRFDVRTVDQQVHRPGAALAGDLDKQGLLPSAQGAEIRHWPIKPCHLTRLATVPVACRKGSLNTPFRVRQAWIAASEKTAWRPRLPVGGASHGIPGSNQT